MREFLCPCCGGGAKTVKISEILVVFLENLRRAWGSAIIVNSGWRCAAHNLKVGGTKYSRHLIGCAADIAPAGSANGRSFEAIAERICRQPGWEFIAYPTFVHIAAPRDESTRPWSGGNIINL